MLLKEHFESSGTFIFRWRSWLPFLLPILFLEAFTNFHYPYGSHNLDQIWEIICLVISFSGLAVRAFTSGTVPKGTSGRNTKRVKGDFLNITGMYSIVRHPLYLGNFAIGLGVSLIFRLWWFTLIYVLIFWLYYERIMFAEEEFLRRKFGQFYVQWANSTPTFFPKVKNWKPPTLPFSFRTAVKREYNSAMAIIGSFIFLEILSELFINGKIVVDLLWVILFFWSVFTWIIIRIIHKKTKLLHLEGR